MRENARLSRREGLVEAEVDGEIVALHIDKGVCYGFNPTATRLWQLLDAPATLGQLCDTLEGEYEARRDELRQDIVAVATELENEGLVSIER